MADRFIEPGMAKMLFNLNSTLTYWCKEYVNVLQLSTSICGKQIMEHEWMHTGPKP